GAETAWRQGAALGRATPRPAEPDVLSVELPYLIMASLTDQLTADEARQFRGLIWGRRSAASEPSPVVEAALNLLPPEAERPAWRPPRGGDLAQRLAFRALSYAEFTRLPGVLIVGKAINLAAFGGAATPEQEQLVWDLAGAGLDACARGRLSLDAN